MPPSQGAGAGCHGGAVRLLGCRDGLLLVLAEHLSGGATAAGAHYSAYGVLNEALTAIRLPGAASLFSGHATPPHQQRYPRQARRQDAAGVAVARTGAQPLGTVGAPDEGAPLKPPPSSSFNSTTSSGKDWQCGRSEAARWRAVR